jgi:hypothetical protein
MLLSLQEGEVGVTIVLIAFNNQDSFKVRLEREVLPTITAHPFWKFQVVIIDNSDEDQRVPYDILHAYHLPHFYKWTGANIMYGPAMNLALQATIYPYLVYVCSNHGRMYDPTWIDDLIDPIIHDPKVAMTGCYCGSFNPEYIGFPAHLPHVHIQGGVFGARTEALLAHPYTDDPQWAHLYSDIFESYQLLNAGFQLYHVATICSVWRQCIESPERWKYVHDNSEE